MERPKEIDLIQLRVSAIIKATEKILRDMEVAPEADDYLYSIQRDAADISRMMIKIERHIKNYG